MTYEATPQVDPGEPTLSELITQAESQGNWGLAGMLKMQALRISAESPPEPTPERAELDEWIQTAEQEERWEDARMLKLQALQSEMLAPEEGEEPPDENLLRKIAEAEEDQNWPLVMRLKAQAAGITP